MSSASVIVITGGRIVITRPSEALLWTLDKGLGDKFTHDVREAWTVTYTLLADTKEISAKVSRGVPVEGIRSTAGNAA